MNRQEIDELIDEYTKVMTKSLNMPRELARTFVMAAMLDSFKQKEKGEHKRGDLKKTINQIVKEIRDDMGSSMDD